MSDNNNEKTLAAEEASQANPGDFAKTSTIMNNDVTGDNDTNGISASMVRFGDEDNLKYADKLNEVGEEMPDQPND